MTIKKLIDNVQIFDGTGDPPFSGAVLIAGDKIAAVHLGDELPAYQNVERVDGAGGFLMPGLVEAHAHLGFGNTVHHLRNARTADHDEKLLLSAHAAKTLLDHGFTSLYSGGAVDAPAEVALRDAIATGIITGPRLRACSFEKSASAAKVDLATIYGGTDGRESDCHGVRDFVKAMADIGVDSVKFVVTGESGVRPGTSRVMQFFEDEIAAAGDEARKQGVWLNAHCHSAESVKMCVRQGFRGIFHATWADEEAVDMMVDARDSIFVAPSPGINWANIHEGGPFGITQEMAREQEQFLALELTTELVPKLIERGVRVVPGGDYGFPWNPVGKNARDLKIFVEVYGLDPALVLKSATLWGGEIMDLPTGVVREGYLADLLIVDGNPLEDIAILQEASALKMIMLGGKIHKSTLPGTLAA